MSPAEFRAIFPEFGDQGRYPEARIAFALREADARLLPEVWGELRDSGIANYVAHGLALYGPSSATSETSPASLVPGLATGLVTSKSVGPMSKSYDVSVGQTEGGGIFNMTTYGQAFLTLARSVAVGARQF